MSQNRAPKFFAIIPAAGESRRMGSPKLLLPVQGNPLIAHTIAAWVAAGLQPIAVVREGDECLANVCRECGAIVIQPPLDPPEMKISVLIALAHIDQTEQPLPSDAWLLAPADMPRLSPAIIRALVAAHAERVRSALPPSILVPTISGQRGHPVLFPWPLAAQVSQLGTDEGINALAMRHPVQEIACDTLPTLDAFCDIDTPADYERFNK